MKKSVCEWCWKAGDQLKKRKIYFQADEVLCVLQGSGPRNQRAESETLGAERQKRTWGISWWWFTVGCNSKTSLVWRFFYFFLAHSLKLSTPILGCWQTCWPLLGFVMSQQAPLSGFWATFTTDLLESRLIFESFIFVFNVGRIPAWPRLHSPAAQVETSCRTT